MRYIVTKKPDGQFTGVCAEEWFNDHRDVFLDKGDTYECFEGPENLSFEQLKQLAKQHCKPPYDEKKFAPFNDFLRYVAQDPPGGSLDVHNLRMLGDTYDELVENLYRIAELKLTLRITPRKKPNEGGA